MGARGSDFVAKKNLWVIVGCVEGRAGPRVHSASIRGRSIASSLVIG